MAFLKQIYGRYLFPIQSILRFYWYSKNEHAVHSPFVFNLVTKCFYDKTIYQEYEVLNRYRKALLNNHNTIEVADFGAGSRVFKSNIRQISQIAKTAGISKKRAELLFRMVNYFKPNEILEIGTSLGLATSAMALGNSESNITSLEGCGNTLSVTEELFKVSGFKFQDLGFKSQNLGFKFQVSSCDRLNNRINFVNCQFEEFLSVRLGLTLNLKPETHNPKLITDNSKPTTHNSQLTTHNPQPKTYNLIYFDGNHSKQATLDYFELLLPTIDNDSVWIFDDIHWSQDMEQAWEVIKNHEKVTVTIDTFQWGIVFFRKEQEKEHFVIRV